MFLWNNHLINKIAILTVQLVINRDSSLVDPPNYKCDLAMRGI